MTLSGQSAALSAAAYRGDLPSVRQLVIDGVDPNIWDRWGRTPLVSACGAGHFEIADFLLSNGAWIDPHEDYDTLITPLMAAAQNGHIEIVRLLISKGANPLLHVGVTQATADFYARQNGHLAVHEFLKQFSE